MSDRITHAPHLSVAPLVNSQLYQCLVRAGAVSSSLASPGDVMPSSSEIPVASLFTLSGEGTPSPMHGRLYQSRSSDEPACWQARHRW